MKNTIIQGLNAGYYENGKGEPVIFVHCSSASHKEWLPISQDLNLPHQAIIPDLIGYGTSSTWAADNGLDISVDLDFIEHLIQLAEQPVHLIGHSYGGALCIETATRHFDKAEPKIKSLLVIEPVSFHFLIQANNVPAIEEIFPVAHGTINSVKQGDLEKAAEIYMGFWIGLENWHAASERYRAEVIRTMHKVAAEFDGIEKMSGTIDQLKRITCPVSLAKGQYSPKSALTVVEIIENAISHSKLTEIPGAGHMSPFSHREQITQIVKNHLESVIKLDTL